VGNMSKHTSPSPTIRPVTQHFERSPVYAGVECGRCGERGYVLNDRLESLSPHEELICEPCKRCAETSGEDTDSDHPRNSPDTSDAEGVTA